MSAYDKLSDFMKRYYDRYPRHKEALLNTTDENWPLGVRDLDASQAIQIALSGYEVTLTSGEIFTADNGQLFQVVNGQKFKRSNMDVRMSWPSSSPVDNRISCVVREK